MNEGAKMARSAKGRKLVSHAAGKNDKRQREISCVREGEMEILEGGSHALALPGSVSGRTGGSFPN